MARGFSSLLARKNFDFAQDDIQWGITLYFLDASALTFITLHSSLCTYYTSFLWNCQSLVNFINFKLFVNFIEIARAGVVKYYYLCYNIYNYMHDTKF